MTMLEDTSIGDRDKSRQIIITLHNKPCGAHGSATVQLFPVNFKTPIR